MWLLNVTTRKLEHFVDEQTKYGRYAILSHTWAEEEVTFQDIESGDPRAMKGYAKIENTCRRAIEDKLDYCWIDTCCINKQSSAELSEAVNSMFRWYSCAKVCYAFLADVPDVPLEKSRWFSRGWTLQELIAPGYLIFYDGAWGEIGTKHGMIDQISLITRIDKDVLRDREALASKSVACRMAWAANRATSRVEDRAYSLLGIFDISMPMLYGEGDKAFTKLQEELVRTSTDHSILAWQPYDLKHARSLFAPSPYGFRDAHNIISWSTPGIDESFQLSNKGLRINLPVFLTTHYSVAVLNCRKTRTNNHYQIGLPLRMKARRLEMPVRVHNTPVFELFGALRSDPTMTQANKLADVDRTQLARANRRDLLILREPVAADSDQETLRWTRSVTFEYPRRDFQIDYVSPSDGWKAYTSTLTTILTGVPELDRGRVHGFELSLAGDGGFLIDFEHGTLHDGEPDLRVGIRALKSHGRDQTTWQSLPHDLASSETKLTASRKLCVESTQHTSKGHWNVRLYEVPVERKKLGMLGR